MVTRFDRPSEAVQLDEAYFGPDLIYKPILGEDEEDLKDDVTF